jgi:urease accessory protein
MGFGDGAGQALHQRARGVLAIAAKRSGARSRLADLRQEGCLHACFPRTDEAALHAVLLNSSGGVADGDTLRTTLLAEAGASLVVATQAAERVYRARAGAAPARVDVAVRVAAGACVEYLPQETILFDACALERRLRVDVAPDGRYVGVETLIFGRAAAGEVVGTLRLRDRIDLYRDGKHVLHDAVVLQGDVAGLLQRRAIAAGARAVATMFYVAADAGGRLDAVRAALDGVTGGASCRDGALVARIVAADGVRARRAVVTCLAALRDDRPLPRVWSC